MNKYKPVYKSKSGKEAILKKYTEFLSKWPVPHEDFYIDTCLGKTFIRRSGDKTLPPLLLLHGTSSNSTIWVGEFIVTG
ncbi:MAG: hypothetical protein CVU87_04880 [Firmicutes bacterium HGW-Firmicutes-12]|jgi:hypothetical protein|nr:MAG: hypothetical protein CVU87_04880 [Firmicutes bacterium HGW-Firmicutes-12]